MQKLIFFLISGLIGIELFAGIVIAPTLFYPQRFGIEVPLTLYQSGLLMTRVFVILGYVLFTISLFATLYALWSKKKLFFMITLSVLALAGMFAFYFTPFIIHIQSLGELATQSIEFTKIHTYSEWCLKLIIFLQLVALFSLHSNSKIKDSAL